jgi:hypothetical protein
VISVLIVIGIFWWAIPKYANYRDVWAAMKTLTPIETWSLVAATIFNLVTYWWANQAALPGLGIGKAAVLTQTTTSVANTLPAGGAIAVGLTYSILDSWGFSGTSVALYVGVTGIWNIFAKLGLPMLALVFLALSGHLTPTYILAAVDIRMLMTDFCSSATAGFDERFERRPLRGQIEIASRTTPPPYPATQPQAIRRDEWYDRPSQSPQRPRRPIRRGERPTQPSSASLFSPAAASGHPLVAS